MKDKRDYRDYLHDILRYAEMAERVTLGVDFETFCSNDEKTLAAIQILEVVGEASKNLPKSAMQTEITIQNRKLKEAFLQR